MAAPKFNWRLYITSIIANILSLLCGHAYAFTSPVLPKLNGQIENDDNPFGHEITPMQESWIAGCLSLGAFFGPIIAGSIVDKIGRKRTLLLITLPVSSAYLILFFARTVELYYFARTWLGLGIGCVYSTIPIYIGEIAEDHNRGALGCLHNIISCFGTFTLLLIGPYISVQMLCLFCMLPVVIFFILFIWIAPESPYYLVLTNQDEEAKLALHQLRHNNVEKKLEEIKKNVEEAQNNRIRFRELLKSKAIVKGLILGLGIMFFQQFSGTVVVSSYMQSIFAAAGSSLPSEISTIIVAFIQVLVNLVTAQLVDRLGRKILLISSLFGLFIAHASLGTFFFCKTNGYDVSSLGALPIISLILFVIAYNLGIGTISWAMLGELFPSEIKSLATTLSTCLCLMFAFLLTTLYPNLSLIIGVSGFFWMFSVACLLGVAFVFFVLPETKGKSLYEIQLLLGGESYEKRRSVDTNLLT